MVTENLLSCLTILCLALINYSFMSDRESEFHSAWFLSLSDIFFPQPEQDGSKGGEARNDHSTYPSVSGNARLQIDWVSLRCETPSKDYD